MNRRTLYLGLWLLLSPVLLVACQAESSSGGGDAQFPELAVTIQLNGKSINLTALAGLDQTTRIDVLRREDGDDSTAVHFEELSIITDDETIHALVEALDGDLDLEPRVRCPALYTLVFHLRDGRQHEFGYACEMASPSFLRGGQLYWQGKEAIAPDAFNRVLSDILNEYSNLEIPF